MSTALYPLGMKSYNNHLPQGGYESWKGGVPFQNPIGITATHIRPLTNKDYGNVFPAPFGKARPMKHWRRGTSVPVHTPFQQIDYNLNRATPSSTGSSLGGGAGGFGMISSTIGTPGSVIIKEGSGTHAAGENIACTTCTGTSVVSSWYPITNLTEKPVRVVTTPPLCCNEQRKAIRRVLPTSTNVKKQYFQTTSMYLYNRCQTFGQRQFNFVTHGGNAKPGSALALADGQLYVAQCNPNVTLDPRSTGICQSACSRVYYKPSNPSFAVQGAVSSGTLTTALKVKTIETSAAQNDRYNQVQTAAFPQSPNIPFIYKFKGEKCQPGTYSGNPYFFSGQFQNHKICGR